MGRAALTKAMESTSLVETERLVLGLRLDKRAQELQEARKIASRRSGTRGKEARLDEIKAEERVAEAEQACVQFLVSQLGHR